VFAPVPAINLQLLKEGRKKGTPCNLSLDDFFLCELPILFNPRGDGGKSGDRFSLLVWIICIFHLELGTLLYLAKLGFSYQDNVNGYWTEINNTCSRVINKVQTV
jgi:hypothetical protein